MIILILANDAGGLWVFRRELVEELIKENQVYYCTPEGAYASKLNSLGCKHIPCGLLDRHGTNPLKDLQLISFYKKILREIKPDIVFTYTIKCNAYGGMACASQGVPYVANVTGLGTAIEKGGLMQKVSLTLYKKGIRKAQKVFFQNTENRDFMVSHGVVKGPYDMLPGSGVNLKRYEAFPYPDGETTDFVFISRIMKEKGIDQYLDAAKEIKKRHPRTRFHICGYCEQDYEAELQELDKEGVIMYHGLVDDMKSIYRMISCTVHPTYYPEGLSNVLLESAASGRPIITTDRAGCREVVEDGINGYVVRQKDSKDLIEKIERFLSLTVEERRAMGLAGRAKVEREFDRQIVIQKYLEEVKTVGKQKCVEP